MLQVLDKNMNYELQFSETKWHDKYSNIPNNLQKCFTLIVNNIDESDDLKEENRVPEECTFVIGVEDAKYLHAWLGAFLNAL